MSQKFAKAWLYFWGALGWASLFGLIGAVVVIYAPWQTMVAAIGVIAFIGITLWASFTIK